MTATELKKISDDYKGNSATNEYSKAIKFIEEVISPFIEKGAKRGMTRAVIRNNTQIDYKMLWVELNKLGYKVTFEIYDMLGIEEIVIEWSKPKVRKEFMWFFAIKNY